MRTLLATAALALLAPATAGAAEVIVVDGERAERRHDPAVPSKASVALPRPPGAARPVAMASSKRGRRAVARALRARGISRRSRARHTRAFSRAIATHRRLRGARRSQLGYVIASLERMALRGRLTSSRLPALFSQLERNTRYWPKLPYPASGDQISFGGSEVLYQYYPGRGLQLQPLSTFKKANNMHGACVKGGGPCRRAGLRDLLNEMSGLAVRRGRGFIAWEYMFDFGGGAPPWMSGMAQATGIQAYGRASRLLGQPGYVATAQRALGAFSAGAPTGVRATGPGGGTHYLQYSFAPRLFIFNAFLQSLIGLYDFDQDTNDARAAALYRRAEPQARRELPASDVGDWSRYSYRGAESTREYHELLREFLQSMCNRRLGATYCTFARRYRGYQVDPPVLTYEGPETATDGSTTRIRFNVSKLSAVEVTVTEGSKVVFRRQATFRRGAGSFAWKPTSPGSHAVRLGAKELRTGAGKRDSATGRIEVEAN